MDDVVKVALLDDRVPDFRFGELRNLNEIDLVFALWMDAEQLLALGERTHSSNDLMSILLENKKDCNGHAAIKGASSQGSNRLSEAKFRVV
jgi:hypothetical protein